MKDFCTLKLNKQLPHKEIILSKDWNNMVVFNLKNNKLPFRYSFGMLQKNSYMKQRNRNRNIH